MQYSRWLYWVGFLCQFTWGFWFPFFLILKFATFHIFFILEPGFSLCRSTWACALVVIEFEFICRSYRFFCTYSQKYQWVLNAFWTRVAVKLAMKNTESQPWTSKERWLCKFFIFKADLFSGAIFIKLSMNLDLYSSIVILLVLAAIFTIGGMFCFCWLITIFINLFLNF